MPVAVQLDLETVKRLFEAQGLAIPEKDLEALLPEVEKLFLQLQTLRKLDLGDVEFSIPSGERSRS